MQVVVTKGVFSYNCTDCRAFLLKLQFVKRPERTAVKLRQNRHIASDKLNQMSEGSLINTISSAQRRTVRRLAILSNQLRQYENSGTRPQCLNGLIVGMASSSLSSYPHNRDAVFRNFALSLLAAREALNDGAVEAGSFAATKLPTDFSLSDTYEVIQHMFSKSALQQHGKTYGGVGGYKLGW